MPTISIETIYSINDTAFCIIDQLILEVSIKDIHIKVSKKASNIEITYGITPINRERYFFSPLEERYLFKTKEEVIKSLEE